MTNPNRHPKTKNQHRPATKVAGRFFTGALAAGIIACGSAHAFAASGSWLAAPTDGNWEASGTETNWSNGAALFPGLTSGTSSSDTATFNVASSETSINVAAQLIIGSLTFDTSAASAYTISGANIRIASGKTWQMTSTVANPQVVEDPLLINAALSINNNAAGAANTFTLSGATIKPSNSTTTAIITLGGTNPGLNTISSAIGVPSTSTQSMTINKAGAGTWILAGTNTYTGNTNVNAGMLAITGATAAGSSVIIAAAGTLGGTGTVGGAIDNSGTIAPGVNGVGALTLGSTLMFEAGSTLAFDAGASATTSDTDLVTFSTLADSLQGSGNATLALGGTIDYTKTYTIFQNVSTPAFSFAAITGYDTADFSASVAPSGNDYVLTFTPTSAVPEPASLSLLAIGALGLLARRRRQA